MSWLRKEPKEERYTGEKDSCVICFKELRIDDVYEEYQSIPNLGRVCPSCFLSELESQELDQEVSV